MKPTPLCWIGSFLTLHSVSSSALSPSFKKLPNEMQHAIMVQVGFCEYVLSVDKGVITPASPKVENVMLATAAKKEWGLELNDDTQRVRKQQLLKCVRALVRLYSKLLIVCTTTDTEVLEHLAKLFDSTYRDFSCFSDSPTWKKACMGGLFGRNTLIKLLPHLSDDFRRNTEKILLQTAFFIGDSDALEAITKSFVIRKDDVPSTVSELDIVFSNYGTFFKELFELLPKVMDKRLKLIRKACSLNRLDILLRILGVAKPAELDELIQILGSFCRLKMLKYESIEFYSIEGKVSKILQIAAQHGHLPIIRFLWPMMATMPNRIKMVIRNMMIEANRNNHCSVLEFLM